MILLLSNYKVQRKKQYSAQGLLELFLLQCLNPDPDLTMLTGLKPITHNNDHKNTTPGYLTYLPSQISPQRLHLTSIFISKTYAIYFP